MKLKIDAHGADPVLTQAVNEDKVPWYKKPNLRLLYLLLLPTCMYVVALSVLATKETVLISLGRGIEITSGFDSQLISQCF